jgi:hypothetical protein
VPIEITNVVDWLQSDWYPREHRFDELKDEFADVHPSFPVSWFEFKKENGRRAVCCVVDEDGDWIVLLIDQCLDGPFGHTPVVAQVGYVEFPGDIGGIRFSYNQDEPDGQRSARFLVANAAVPALMAQTLMHCKNVSVVQQPKQPKLIKKSTRNHGVPPSQFRTIVIDPMKAATRSSGCPRGEAGNKQRMHVIRGHYKTYTLDRKLFGKVAGRFFFSSHVAGDASIGTITTDYIVKPRKTA